MMIINAAEFRKKVLGCWMGKNIGGTLGAPFEWKRQVNHIDFYTQELGGEPLPNDDLDVQLLWLIALEERGVELTAQTLSEYWTLYLTPHWSEYGIAKINMRSGLMPPLSGTMFNEYKDSCGSFLRSEIWACIAPGNPRLAARYAYQDAIIDHGNGEGTYAEVFCAALESAAFITQDIPTLIKIALSYIPKDCGVAGAVCEAQSAFESGKSWLEARNQVLEKYRGLMFFNMREAISDEDWEKGLGSGQRGWDVPSNIGMLIIGLLYGQGDFGKSVCTAVNCGEDTDCTGATLGSLFGILHGIDGIPQSWIAPIGHTIKTACLNLGELGYFGNQLPANVEDLTDRTIRITHMVGSRFNSSVKVVEDQPTDVKGISLESLMAGPEIEILYKNLAGPIFHFDFFDLALDYGDEGPLIKNGIPKSLRLRIYNHYKVQANLSIHWYTPEGWKISPARDGYALSLPSHLGEPIQMTFQIEIEQVSHALNRAAIEITIEGRPTAMLVPVALLNGNLLP
jgi:ADP-ribosylglycohydrolase